MISARQEEVFECGKVANVDGCNMGDSILLGQRSEHRRQITVSFSRRGYEELESYQSSHHDLKPCGTYPHLNTCDVHKCQLERDTPLRRSFGNLTGPGPSGDVRVAAAMAHERIQTRD